MRKTWLFGLAWLFSCVPESPVLVGLEATEPDSIATRPSSPPLTVTVGQPPPGGTGTLSRPWNPAWPTPQTTLEAYGLFFGPQTQAIIEDPSRGREYAPGQFQVEGVWQDVGLRYRGDGARFHPKKSYKVKLAEGVRHQGARRFNFLAEWLDAGYLTDPFSYRLMEAAGVAAPRSRLVTLDVNGVHQGIYVQLEQVDKSFLENHRLEKSATVYRCGSKDCELKLTPPAHYQKPFEKKTNEEDPSRADLDSFLWGLSRTPEHELPAFLARRMDLDGFLRTLAVDVLIGMHGIDDSGSYLVHEHGLDRWTFVPWDLNNSRMLWWRQEELGASPRVSRSVPVYTLYDAEALKTYDHKQSKYGGAHLPFSVLHQRVWDHPTLRSRVLDDVERLLSTVFTEQAANEEIESLHALIEEALPRDPWVDRPHADAAPDYLQRYVRGRRDFLSRQLPLERKRGEGGVVINAVGADGRIELFNREDHPVDLRGKVLTDNLRDPFKYRLGALSVPARSILVLFADGEPARGETHLPFRVSSDGGEVGLFDGQSRINPLDVLYLPPLPENSRYARTHEGAESWGWRP